MKHKLASMTAPRCLALTLALVLHAGCAGSRLQTPAMAADPDIQVTTGELRLET